MWQGCLGDRSPGRQRHIGADDLRCCARTLCLIEPVVEGGAQFRPSGADEEGEVAAEIVEIRIGAAQNPAALRGGVPRHPVDGLQIVAKDRFDFARFQRLAGGGEAVLGLDIGAAVIGFEPAGMHRVLHHADAVT